MTQNKVCLTLKEQHVKGVSSCSSAEHITDDSFSTLRFRVKTSGYIHVFHVFKTKIDFLENFRKTQVNPYFHVLTKCQNFAHAKQSRTNFRPGSLSLLH